MSLTVTSAPSVEPITTAEAKEWLRIDTSDTSQDVVLALLIKSVRVRLEEHLRRSFITRTYSWEANYDDVFGGQMELPRPPVQSVTSVTTYDDSSGSEVSTVVTSTNYQLVEKAYIVDRNDGWDANRIDRAATVVYVAGYGDVATGIPQDIKMAMLELLALRFERRGDEDRDLATSREHAILESVDHYRIIGY